MVGNLWLWPRLIAAFAVSLILLSPASAQESQVEKPAIKTGEQAVSPLAKTALRDLRLAALADQRSIAVQWRYLSNGETIKVAPKFENPELLITGVKAKSTPLSPYGELNTETTIVILLAGKSASENKYFSGSAYAAASALPKGSYRIIVGEGGAGSTPIEWVIDKKMNVESDSQIWDGFFTAEKSGALPTSNPETRMLVKGLASSMEILKQGSPQSRLAIIAPEGMFPGDEALLKKLTETAFAQRISFFPIRPAGGVTPARAQQMNNVAGPTGGRFLPDDIASRSIDEKRVLFSEFASGAATVYDIAPHQQYLLPGETAKPLELVVNYGDLTDTLTLRHERPVLTGGALFKAFLNPVHWGNWLFDGSRWPYGLGALALWAIVLFGLIRLLVPPVKLYVQIAGENGIQKLRRLPAKIGRGTHAQINLDNDGVSREHAEIRKDGHGMVLVDLGSSNGTWIGGERVKSTPISKVQTVQIGPVRLILRPRRVGPPIERITANSQKQ